MLNLDTHILAFALEGSLRPGERRLLISDQWGISAIVLWELAKLRQLGRVAIDLDSAEFRRIFARVHIWPLDVPVCQQSAKLDFSGDPADGLIASTSIIYRVPLVTRDLKIRRSKLVPIAGA